MAEVIDLDSSDESMEPSPDHHEDEEMEEDADSGEEDEDEEESSEVIDDEAVVSTEDDEYDMTTDGQETYEGMFELLRAGDAYHANGIQAISHNRRRLGNELFFDRLTKQLKVKDAKKLYPPRDAEDLLSLHNAIVSSPVPEHYRQSLIFYILLDRHADGLGESDAPDRYAEKTSMPDTYTIMMRGLWHIDRLQFEDAIEYITYPSLIPTFAPEILFTLLTHSKDNDLTLPLAYYHSTYPPLTDSHILDAFFRALAQASTPQAYSFIKTQPSSIHQHLFEKLVGETLSHPALERRAEKALELISLPLSLDEEDWFEQYLSKGDGQKMHGAKETLMMRQLAQSNYASALGGNKKLAGRRKDGVNWQDLKQGFESGLGSRQNPSPFASVIPQE